MQKEDPWKKFFEEVQKHTIPVPRDQIVFSGRWFDIVKVPAAELEKWNRVKYNAMVMRNGRAWPKARVISETAKQAKVEVSADDGKTIEETKTLRGAELEQFRELNASTAPSDQRGATIDAAVQKVIDEANAELEKTGFKLPNGEPYPKVHSLAE